MLKGFWTAPRLNDAIAELRGSSSVGDVCKRLSARWGAEVTGNSIRNAFSAAGKMAPSAYLRGMEGPVVERDTEPPTEYEPRRPTWEDTEEKRDDEYHVHAPPPEIDRDELIERRKKQFAEKKKSELANKLIRVDVKMRGPIGILFFGDPHVDDDGTDIDALERHTELVRTTPGLFAGNVGDSTNNWVGRLARLYAQQSTSAAEAWALAEWFVNRCRWLFMVAGNHDVWSGAGDPLKWISQQSSALYKETSVRLGLQFSNGREVRVNVRHDFAGHSQWNPAHGAMKAAQFGTADHLLVNGHKHVSGYGVIRDPNSGLVSHCVQVASYKIFDRYAKEKGFREQTISPCATAIIDPEGTEASLIQVFWEPEPAAEYLTWLRKKRAA